MQLNRNKNTILSKWTFSPPIHIKLFWMTELYVQSPLADNTITSPFVAYSPIDGRGRHILTEFQYFDQHFLNALWCLCNNVMRYVTFGKYYYSRFISDTSLHVTDNCLVGCNSLNE